MHWMLATALLCLYPLFYACTAIPLLILFRRGDVLRFLLMAGKDRSTHCTHDPPRRPLHFCTGTKSVQRSGTFRQARADVISVQSTIISVAMLIVPLIGRAPARRITRRSPDQGHDQLAFIHRNSDGTRLMCAPRPREAEPNTSYAERGHICYCCPPAVCGRSHLLVPSEACSAPPGPGVCRRSLPCDPP